MDPLPSDSSVCNGICSSNYQLCDSFLRGVWAICHFLVSVLVCVWRERYPEGETMAFSVVRKSSNNAMTLQIPPTWSENETVCANQLLCSQHQKRVNHIIKCYFNTSCGEQELKVWEPRERDSCVYLYRKIFPRFLNVLNVYFLFICFSVYAILLIVYCIFCR